MRTTERELTEKLIARHGEDSEDPVEAAHRRRPSKPRHLAASGPTRRQAGAVTAILTAGLCAGVMLTPVPAGAAADIDPPDMEQAQLSTQQVVMPAAGSVPVRVRVHLSDPQGVAVAMVHAMPDNFVDVVLADPGGLDPDDFINLIPSPASLRLVAGTKYDGTWAGTIRIRRTNLTGPYTVGLSAIDSNDNMAGSMNVGQFRARYGTAVKADITPTTTPSDDAVTVSGRLRHVTPAGWAPLAHRRVEVQVRPAGSDRWATKGTLLTGSDGTFADASRFHANRDGAWRIRFAGGRTQAPAASVADTVTVS